MMIPTGARVYHHCRFWRDHIDPAGGQPLLELVLKKLVAGQRLDHRRQEETTLLILDSRSVENLDTAEEKGYDGGKKISRIKRHIGVDSQGLPHVLHVTAAKRNELHKFVVIPQRWGVERSFAWLEKCRQLWKNCERKLSTSLAMARLAFISLLLRRS